MQDWATVIVVLLILGVLLDGARRVRAHRRASLRMSRRVVDDVADSDEGLSTSGFPSGGPRVAAYRDPKELENVNQHLKKNYVASRMTRGAPSRIPDQVSLKLDKSVPMLMESVEEETPKGSAAATDNEESNEPRLGSLQDLEDQASSADSSEEEPPKESETRSDNERDAAVGHSSQSRDKAAKASRSKDTGRHRDQDSDGESDAGRAPDEVLIINVMAGKGEYFKGPALLDALVSQGLRFGDMDIFHRHESSDGSGRILFSVANIVVPGTFELGAMEDFETPGISMFLSLPAAGDSIAAFNLMAEAAQAIVEQLGGELKDENRSVMTRQTIEHARQRVVEYERKRRLAR